MEGDPAKTNDYAHHNGNMKQEQWSSFCDSLLMEDDRRMEALRLSMEERGIPIIRRETEYFLRWVIAATSPEKILEVGTAAGYSAIYMLVHASGSATIDTIEQDERVMVEAYDNFKNMGCSDRITQFKGDAARIIEDLAGGYDMIFLDAAKGQYIAMLPRLKILLADGGILVTDNILHGGDILLPRFAVRRRDRTIHRRMREYLYAITHDGMLVTDIFPSGDGIAVSTKHEKT